MNKLFLWLNNSKKNPVNIIVMSAILMIIAVIITYCITVIINSFSQDQAIVFEDKNLQKAVQESLKDPCITIKEAKEVRKIEIDDHPEITSLEDLKHFTNLEELIITHCNISSLEGLETLSNLTSLDLGSNNISSIQEICNEKHANLTYLCLDENPVRDLPKELSKLNNLTELSLQSCMLSGSFEISNMDTLETVKLGNNSINEIKGNFISLQEVSLNNNCVETISNLTGILNIKILRLSGNPIDSLEGIDKFISLELLDIRRTEIQDISKLKNLKKLNALYLDEDFDRSEVDFLKQNFKNGAVYTKKYILSKRYSLK